jgi:hypothetical protein
MNMAKKKQTTAEESTRFRKVAMGDLDDLDLDQLVELTRFGYGMPAAVTVASDRPDLPSRPPPRA